MTPAALAKAVPTDEKPAVRYLDYLQALETLNAHRVNPAPPFALMLAFAFSLHIALTMAWSILGGPNAMPQERILQLRLGGSPELGEGPAVNGGGLAPTREPEATPRTAASMLEQALGPSDPEPARTPARSRPATSKSIASSYRAKPAPQLSRLAPRASAADALRPVPGLPATGGRGVKGGSAYGNSTAAQAEVISRYEQELSGWLERHKVYPAEAARAGLQGRVVVRVQMNRQGKVLGNWIEKSSGHAILDKAVLAQVRRADPFPPAPATYPGSTMLEFRFPVTLFLR